MMKKLIFKSFVVVCISALVFVVLIVASAYVSPQQPFRTSNLKHTIGGYGYSKLRFQEADSLDRVDILFSGSSHTYRGFDPKIFDAHGVSSFNLGSSSQKPFLTKKLLQRYLDRLNPEVVVLDTYWTLYESDDVSESTLDLLSNCTFDEGVVEMLLEANDFSTYASSLYIPLVRRFHDIPQSEFDGDTYEGRGYVTRNMAGWRPDHRDSLTVEFSERQLEILSEIKSLCKEKGARLILCHSPVTSHYRDGITNYSLVDSTFASYADANTLWLDYNGKDKIDLDEDACFFDDHHLLPCGVSDFNASLIAEIKESGFWPDL